jgi:hypothetical protein
LNTSSLSCHLTTYHLPHAFFKQIAAALEKAEIDIPADTKAKLSACFASPGVITLADAIKDMGAISSVNLLKNDISVAQAEDLVSILKEHPTLKSLCGNSGDETELDMSGKLNGAADAIMIVAEIIDNGALIKLDISSNGIGAEQEENLQHICMTSGIELDM